MLRYLLLPTTTIHVHHLHYHVLPQLTQNVSNKILWLRKKKTINPKMQFQLIIIFTLFLFLLPFYLKCFLNFHFLVVNFHFQILELHY